jgi:hypothetical protein
MPACPEVDVPPEPPSPLDASEVLEQPLAIPRLSSNRIRTLRVGECSASQSELRSLLFETMLLNFETRVRFIEAVSCLEKKPA